MSDRKHKTRQRIMEGARRLILERGTTDFSMNELAEASKVSLATPYNHFGSKQGVLLAVVGEDLAVIGNRFDATGNQSAIERIFDMAVVGVETQIAHSALLKPVYMALVGVPEDGTNLFIMNKAIDLWAQAIGSDFPFNPDVEHADHGTLARQLSHSFRGITVFWFHGELSDEQMAKDTLIGVDAIISRFVDPEARPLVQDARALAAQQLNITNEDTLRRAGDP